MHKEFVNLVGVDNSTQKSQKTNKQKNNNVLAVDDLPDAINNIVHRKPEKLYENVEKMSSVRFQTSANSLAATDRIQI